MFTGTATPTLDIKHRLLFPAKWRHLMAPAEFGRGFWCTLGPDGSLHLVSVREWDRIQAAIPGFAKAPAERALERMFFGMAELLLPDPQGRLLLPSRLLELAGIAAEAVMLGVRTRLELWAPARYEAFVKDHLDDYFSHWHRLFQANGEMAANPDDAPSASCPESG